MSTKVVQLKDFSKVLGDFSKRTLKEQKAAVARGLARSIPDLVAASPVDTGLYSASWDFRVDDLAGIIGNYAPYAGIIEDGARPFTPPIGPLLAWAKRVLTKSEWEDRDSQGHVTGVRILNDTGQHETNYTPEVWALAKAAQKAIADRGMIPHHIMRDMIPTIIDNIRKELKA